jgi:hypothetical protein
MLLGNGIYYAPRRGLMPSSGPAGGTPSVIPFHSAVSLRRTFDNDRLSFPPGTFQSAIVFAMKYGGISMTSASVGLAAGDIKGWARANETTGGTGSIPTAELTGLKNSPCTMTCSATFSGAVKARAKTTMTVSIGAQPSAFDVAQAVWGMENGIETGWTPRQILRIVASALAGKVSGSAANTPVFRSVTDAKPRITATTNTQGDRTSVSLDSE